MAVCLQSGGLIDTGSLSVQDGLQLSQFGISSNSPNLPISSEREQAQRASTFWMFFLSFRLSSRITPPISLCLPFPILYLSLSLYRCFSVPLAFSLTLHALLLVSFSFLFHLYYFLPFFFPPWTFFSSLLTIISTLSLSFHLLLFFFLCVCFWFLFQEGGCGHCPVLALHNKALMSLHTDVNRNIRPWSHQSAVAMVTKCHRSHPRKKKGERDGEMARRRGEKCAVCVCVWLRSKNLCTGGCLVRIYDTQYLCVKCCMDGGQRSKGSKEQPVILIYRSVCALVCLYYLTSPCTHAAYCISVLVTEEEKKLFYLNGSWKIMFSPFFYLLCSSGQRWRQERRQSCSGCLQWGETPVFLNDFDSTLMWLLSAGFHERIYVKEVACSDESTENCHLTLLFHLHSVELFRKLSANFFSLHVHLHRLDIRWI